ncbi:PH domain-containing protein [Bifidobacterium avesanii]|uniref:PH domain-containing protein n=2 Tax=Bifidobacterium avesanii TaxID=1798157 RepID=A0A7K3TJ18_9BIFI|nr:PH domain-containing protein [Bifidobacterium avesanii]
MVGGMGNEYGPSAADAGGIAATATTTTERDGGGRHGDAAWHALPHRVTRVWTVNAVIESLIVWAVCGAVAAIGMAYDWWGVWPWPAVALGLVVAYGVAGLAAQPLQNRYAYAFSRFSIGERDLRIRKGWLFRSTTVVPFNRIQHVDARQNPVLRHYGLTAVTVHTAVDAHTIEALETAEAERVTDLITNRVARSREDL